MARFVEDFESRVTKRRLRAVDDLSGILRKGLPTDEWQSLMAPLVGTLRDNNFKVCRGALECVELLVGHLDGAIVPFLSALTPAVVECLGNAKISVQSKGVDVLIAVSNPAVNGSSDTLCALERSFRHKNWRVREQLVVYLGRVVGIDSAGLASRPALSSLLADALSDSSSEVRQQALAAAQRIHALMGDKLMTQLEGKGVRPTHLNAL
ncbi:unnamed protein product, partial [Choristocarpus tenellus]